jgi:hypothetical protein
MSTGDAVGGVVQGAATIAAGYMQNKSNEKINQQNLGLAYVQRGDTLKQQGFDNKLALEDRAFRDSEAAYQKRMARRQEVQQRLQNDMAFRNNFIQMLNSVRR